MCDPFKYTHGVLGQTSHLHASLKQKHKSPTSDFNPKTQNQITHLFPPESKQRQNLYLKACKYQTSESSSPPVAAGINKEHFRTLRYLASAPAWTSQTDLWPQKMTLLPTMLSKPCISAFRNWPGLLLLSILHSSSPTAQCSRERG